MLRPLEIGDAPFILELFNSETWLQYIGDRGLKTTEGAEKFLKNNALRFLQERGWATYLITLRQEGTPIGTVGLYEREQLDYPDFGYALLPTFEGVGYATEASQAYLAELQDAQLGLHKILAIVQDNNPRSHRVLEKLGFVRDGTVKMERILQKWEKEMSLIN